MLFVTLLRSWLHSLSQPERAESFHASLPYPRHYAFPRSPGGGATLRHFRANGRALGQPRGRQRAVLDGLH